MDRLRDSDWERGDQDGGKGTEMEVGEPSISMSVMEAELNMCIGYSVTHPCMISIICTNYA